jgi:uncharacterized protein (TIGR00299 family) protein
MFRFGEKMKVAYLDVRNGCAGDMIVAALASCCEMSALRRELSKVKFPSSYTIRLRSVMRSSASSHAFRAYRFIVTPERHEDCASYSAIRTVFSNSALDSNIKKDILRIYEILAAAESRAHGEIKRNLHFHEVGQTDALVEIASAVILLRLLGVEKLYASPVGLANAAPATLEMSTGMPVLFRDAQIEITTPTGMAILKGLVDNFGAVPLMRVLGCGFGAGASEKILPNVLSFVYGEASAKTETVCVVETSVDDINPVLFETIIEKLHAQGAFEVSFCTAVTKKGRPLFLLRVLCLPSEKDRIIETLFEESTTLGIRCREEERFVLEREIRTVKTKYGSIPVKLGLLGRKIVNIAPEYEDCKKVARKYRVPLKVVLMEALKQSNFQ